MAVPFWVPKDLRKDFKKAERQGWTFRKTTNGGQAYAPDGVNIVTFHLTPGRHGSQHVLSKMREYGYKPWRQAIDHRIDIRVAHTGLDPANGDRLLGALHEVLPSADAVIDQNLETGDLTATFVVGAETTGEATKRGIDVFALATDRAGLDSPRTVAIAATECVGEEGPDLAAI